ncbi:phosphatidate cytidylyltransferase [Bacillus sp. REN3]|uniref:phosphatidate cytidylyltransferase n=1 Tax=Bacillus sp. REN3 TaxID=2802440 RepID=UPI001AED19C2|nr:phosphatidate cytidylyltransferase [Bacillus sp. REN3]
MKQRIITAVVAAAIFLPIVIYGGLPFVAMTYLIAAIALFEALRMRRLKLYSVPGILALAMLWVFMVPAQYEKLFDGLKYTKMELFIFGVLLLLAYTVITKNRFTFEEVGFTLLSVLYVGIGFYFFIETRDESLTFVFYSLFIIWATDSGAYFIGRAIGKQKLWPEISPNKTIQGFFGGIASALVVAVLFSVFADMDVSVLLLIIATAFLSVFGQVGDLVESAMKRHYNVKDSGRILPGHGGMLDRFDSLLFVWPLIHLFHLL